MAVDEAWKNRESSLQIPRAGGREFFPVRLGNLARRSRPEDPTRNDRTTDLASLVNERPILDGPFIAWLDTFSILRGDRGSRQEFACMKKGADFRGHGYFLA